MYVCMYVCVCVCVCMYVCILSSVSDCSHCHLSLAMKCANVKYIVVCKSYINDTHYISGAQTQLCGVLPNIGQCSVHLALSPVWRLHSVHVCTAVCLSDLQVTQQDRTHVHRCR